MTRKCNHCKKEMEIIETRINQSTGGLSIILMCNNPKCKGRKDHEQRE